MATIIIGSARQNENGTYATGVKGDSTGKEVSTQNFYIHKKGWYVFRPKDSIKAVELGSKMLEACSNNNIGYSQNDRLAIIKSKITTKTPTNCDCSSLVRECIIEAMGKDIGNQTTGSLPQSLRNSGLFTDLGKYTSKIILQTGDVLVTCTKGHTAIVVQGADTVSTKSNTTTTDKVAKPTLKFGSRGSEVKKLQENLNYFHNNYNSSAFTLLAVDGDYGSNTFNAVKSFQAIFKLTADGIYGSKTYAVMKGVVK